MATAKKTTKKTSAPKEKINPIAKRMAKLPIVTNNVVREEFNYQKGICSLSFTLRTDNSSELRPFADLLEQACKDLREKIAKMKN